MKGEGEIDRERGGIQEFPQICVFEKRSHLPI